MRRWQRQRDESVREPTAPGRRNPRPRKRDHFVKAWAGFGAVAVTAVGASLGASVNEAVTKGLTLGVVGAGFGALVGAVSGDVLNRGRTGLASYRKARREYRQGGGTAAAAGGSIAEIKSDLGLAQDRAQRGIDKYMSARTLFEQALSVAREAMDGSTHPDAEESQRGLETAISTIRRAITAVENGRDGYGKLAEQL